MMNQIFKKLLPKSSNFLAYRPCYSFTKIDGKPDLYGLLQLKPTATADQIKYNYYKLAKKYNPHDKPDPEGQSKLLNEAYIILSNDTLKAKYDKEQGYQSQTFDSLKEGNKFGRDARTNEQEYKEVRSKLGSVLGDKASRTQQVFLTIIAIGTLIGTIMLLTKRGPEVQAHNPKFSKEKFERQYHTNLKG